MECSLKMNEVIVYSKPNCMQCEFTKRWLHENGIPYTAYDVTKNERCVNRVIQLGYQNLPVVYVDKKRHWFGFRPDLMEELKEGL
ncbi:glutaredoxin-like protein NrdH [Abiotrophia defectiva]|uniref:glutaredoxin-like protein NrdH n=1 Tax=Abiotrophia defectiva TaxID=46125 RepID=UPI0028CFF23F|nr:glutaredoxin-like protein NrdH [Abiotrophia defectiva]